MMIENSKSTIQLSSLILFLFGIFIDQTIAQKSLYDCRFFEPYIECGHSLRKDIVDWRLIQANQLIDVMLADPDNLLDYVLVMMNVSSGSYVLDSDDFQQSQYFCLHFELLYSHDCHDENDCIANASLIDLNNHQNRLRSDSQVEYRDSDWRIILVQFDFINQSLENRKNFKISIDGFLKQSNLDRYIALRTAKILDGHCPKIIGPRITFWIIVLIVFSLSACFVFIHLALKSLRTNHSNRLNMHKFNLNGESSKQDSSTNTIELSQSDRIE
ncbi:hypothetical protein SSS_05243 [Sarcoptes scabiei]|uniref:Uncharacterized protein n=1 Tax=Sarcoptes scabiei TaxID=52283 RepID=A0A834RI71_SARSC|nr:hypothetical protein SSS_05243 [Sarcoptes scabiei]